jgi:hypothetical protein
MPGRRAADAGAGRPRDIDGDIVSEFGGQDADATVIVDSGQARVRGYA